MHRLSAIDRTARCASQTPGDNTVTRQVPTSHVLDSFILAAHTVYDDLKAVSRGKPGLHLVGPCARGFLRGRLANPVFHVKPPATAPSLDALTPASSQDHDDSTHYPVSDRDSARPPAEGDHTRVPVHTRPVPRRRTHQRTHRGPPTPPGNPRPRSLDVSLSTDLVHISTSTIAARHCSLRNSPAQTLAFVYIGVCGHPTSPESLLLRAQECTADLSIRRRHPARSTQTKHSTPPRR